MFGEEEPQVVEVHGRALRCLVCEHSTFYRRQAQLHGRLATIFNVEWTAPDLRLRGLQPVRPCPLVLPQCRNDREPLDTGDESSCVLIPIVWSMTFVASVAAAAPKGYLQAGLMGTAQPAGIANHRVTPPISGTTVGLAAAADSS